MSSSSKRGPEPFQLGLEVCGTEPPKALQNARFGLVMNQASVDVSFNTADEVLADVFPGQLAALFGPQHGLWSAQQDNMIETPHALCSERGIPIHSLYADVRKPTAQMLDGLDALVIDLQDVGCRIYTYIWTLSHCLEACAEQGKTVVVLDRPNPLGGGIIEGPTLDPEYASFVGRVPMPMRHGLTMAEAARWLVRTLALDVDLQVVPMRGYRSDSFWFEHGRLWIPPSPNLPRFEGTLLYPGQVLLEGTSLSEGRGTTTPFEVVGAPALDPRALLEELDQVDDALEGQLFAGVVPRPYRFEPTFQKHAGQSCAGLYLHPIDAGALRSYRLTVAILAASRKLLGDGFAWRQPPYEYEAEKMPIDILSGSDALRTAVDAGGLSNEARAALCEPDPAWLESIAPYRLYR